MDLSSAFAPCASAPSDEASIDGLPVDEESIDFDRVLVDLTPPAPTPGFADELPRAWFRHFDSPRLYRLGRLLSRAKLGRHVILAHQGSGQTEQLQVEVRLDEDASVLLHVGIAGHVALQIGEDEWRGRLDRAGEAGLARFAEHVRRLVVHLERYGHQGSAGVLRSIGLSPAPGSCAGSVLVPPH